MEQKQQQKKMWQKPELIVLVRSKPEEAVLATCKSTFFTPGASSQNAACLVDPGCTIGCNATGIS